MPGEVSERKRFALWRVSQAGVPINKRTPGWGGQGYQKQNKRHGDGAANEARGC